MALKRIVLHWTGGGPTVSELDREHYHFIVGQDCKVVAGKMKPEDNDNTADGRYAAHTLNCNTGAIGIAVAGMGGAVERPFSAGAFPIRQDQVEAFCRLAGDLARRYGIPVGPTTVITHAEVQPTLGIVQRGKWDICWIPGMDRPGDPIIVGDTLRAMIRKSMGAR